MSTFNLEERAEELFGEDGSTFSREGAARYAIQLATEALEAAAKECEAQKVSNSLGPLLDAGWNMRGKVDADIIRSFIEKPGAQEERAPRVQSSPDASHGERVSADAPPAPLSDAEAKEYDDIYDYDRALGEPTAPTSEQRRSHDTGGPGGSLPSSGAAASAPSRPGDPLSQSHGKIRDNPRAGDLSDAEILERAAGIMCREIDGPTTPGARDLRTLAAKLRAAEEPVPDSVHARGWQWRPVGDGAFAPPFGTIRQCESCGCLVAGGPAACGRCATSGAAEEADVFEAFGRTAEEDDSGIPCGHSLTIAKDALYWFGPLVEAATNVTLEKEGSLKALRAALSALRERARAAGGGR